MDSDLLEEIPSKKAIKWSPFLEEEFISTVTKCNNSLTPGPDKLLWRYLKRIVKNVECLRKFISIANSYIELGH